MQYSVSEQLTKVDPVTNYERKTTKIFGILG